MDVDTQTRPNKGVQEKRVFIGSAEEQVISIRDDGKCSAKKVTGLVIVTVRRASWSRDG